MDGEATFDKRKRRGGRRSRRRRRRSSQVGEGDEASAPPTQPFEAVEEASDKRATCSGNADSTGTETNTAVPTPPAAEQGAKRRASEGASTAPNDVVIIVDDGDPQPTSPSLPNVKPFKKARTLPSSLLRAPSNTNGSGVSGRDGPSQQPSDADSPSQLSLDQHRLIANKRREALRRKREAQRQRWREQGMKALKESGLLSVQQQKQTERDMARAAYHNDNSNNSNDNSNNNNNNTSSTDPANAKATTAAAATAAAATQDGQDVAEPQHDQQQQQQQQQQPSPSSSPRKQTDLWVIGPNTSPQHNRRLREQQILNEQRQERWAYSTHVHGEPYANNHHHDSTPWYALQREAADLNPPSNTDYCGDGGGGRGDGIGDGRGRVSPPPPPATPSSGPMWMSARALLAKMHSPSPPPSPSTQSLSTATTPRHEPLARMLNTSTASGEAAAKQSRQLFKQTQQQHQQTQQQPQQQQDQAKAPSSSSSSSSSSSMKPVEMREQLTEVPMVLAREQLNAIRAAENGHNIFLTGSAGVGKSFTLKKIITRLAQLNKRVYVTATTGIAAINLEAQATTIHSFSGIRLGHEPAWMLINRISSLTKKNQPGFRWQRCDVLVIDEISMLSASVFSKLDAVGRALRRRKDLPFGGLQLIVCGDFFQLPPVPGIVPCPECGNRDPKHRIFKKSADGRKLIECLYEYGSDPNTSSGRSSKHTQKRKNKGQQTHGKSMRVCRCVFDGETRYAFEPDPLGNNVWSECNFQVHHLVKVYRQSDKSFISALQKVRWGRVDDDVKAVLAAAQRQLSLADNIVPTRLYGQNREVGAQVMLLRNLDTAAGLCNGSRGVVVDFVTIDRALDMHEFQRNSDASPAVIRAWMQQQERLPVVIFENSRLRTIYPCLYSRELDRATAGRYQIPLRLAWAMTIHKCQGMSLDKVEISLDHSFASGQAYVALSRARSLSGLQLTVFDTNVISADPVVFEFYEAIKCKQTNGRDGGGGDDDVDDDGDSTAKAKKKMMMKKGTSTCGVVKKEEEEDVNGGDGSGARVVPAGKTAKTLLQLEPKKEEGDDITTLEDVTRTDNHKDDDDNNNDDDDDDDDDDSDCEVLSVIEGACRACGIDTASKTTSSTCSNTSVGEDVKQLLRDAAAAFVSSSTTLPSQDAFLELAREAFADAKKKT
ncbi:hypothetical protein PTSG_03482 [Salpingoeca rosetta]|uniref:ATP-dependent DNA helicase n=1 Tax=Salpingoeca rosetta (strain ATCC 50818 / BSB-021) TaxID=946362 RepID=F2U5Q9_SALR5|nr:uncharacterized protein PTSG_03482 [Salpingoeca rosetta]EGD82850.1 hypothetical protein PTSG_03482 [Salpingoeca rosetta]|eukprot:XP_004995214.1 hypothetical protein PTSG_03482 [Salpingoeca rosetta]